MAGTPYQSIWSPRHPSIRARDTPSIRTRGPS